MTPRLHLYSNTAGLNHDTGPGHPERPDRLRALLDLFQQPPFDALPHIEARHATLPEIRRAHPQRYIESIEDALPDRGLVGLDGDTILSPGSWDAALEGAGAVCQAVEDVAGGACTRAFCAVRPPGHHAEPSGAMGFCLLNNVFIGARHAQEACGLKRVAIVDFDVHHGNGTDTMTRASDDILFISSHQFPFWPGTGDPADNIPGKVINIALAEGTDGATFRRLYEAQVFPALDNFKPDLLMISAGSDAHRDDPLGGVNLLEEDFAWVTARLATLADRHAKGRIVSVLEGGYNLATLASCTAAHLKALLEKP